MDAYSRLRFEGGHAIRELTGEAAEAMRTLLRSPLRERVFAAGLSTVEVVSDEPGVLTVRSPRVAVRSYPVEWPSLATREAAHTVLRVARALNEVGLHLEDAHLWNIVFDGPRAVWVDLGSLRPGARIEAGWVVEFERRVLAPLALQRLALHEIADATLADPRPGGPTRLLAIPRRVAQLALLANRATGGGPERILGALDAAVSASSPRPRRMRWSTYEQKEQPLDARASFSEKQRTVDRVLSGLAPGSVLDLAANRGWYSELAVHHGHTAIAADVDDAALCDVFTRARRDRAPITTLRFDLAFPRGSHGLGLAYSDVYERVRSDYVLALAILHHLVRELGVTFGWFAALMHRLARRGALIEFVPREDQHVARWNLPEHLDYTQAALLDALRERFAKVEVLPSSPDPRVLVWASEPRER